MVGSKKEFESSWKVRTVEERKSCLALGFGVRKIREKEGKG